MIIIPAVTVAPSRSGIATASRNISGTNATVASSTWRSSPICAATASPASAAKPTSLTGRSPSYMRNSSCRHRIPSASAPIVNTQPP